MKIWERGLVWLYIFGLAFLVACGETAVNVQSSTLPTTASTAELPTATSTNEPTLTPATTATQPSETATVIAPTPTLLPTNTPHTQFTPTPTVESTPNPYTPYTIEAMINRAYGGGLVEIVETLEENELFTRYLVRYPSDGLTIYGFINVPNEGNNFPVVLLLHGYIDPAIYQTVAYTRRYADDLAKAGYFVFHPNFRNYPPSDPGENAFRTGYAIDVLNLIAIIREQSQDPTGTLRRVDEDNIHLWGHSMGGGVALRVVTVNNAEYLKAAVLYGSMSGDERLNFERIIEWSGGQDGAFELAVSPEMETAVSPIYHLDRVNAALAIHHSVADDIVPVEWSQALCDRLEALNQQAACYLYDNQPHTFRGAGDALFMERVINFFKQH